MSETADVQERWACKEPPVGSVYQVIRDEWNKDFTVRTIKEIGIVRVGHPSASA